MESFAQERAAFEMLRRRLVGKHLGRFAVVAGQSLLAVVDSQDEAVRYGMEHGDPIRPFLVRRIEADPRQSVARLPAYVQGLLPA